MTDFSAARLNMVEGQIRPNKVTDTRLIEAMHRVPRELFVPGSLRSVAYVDDDVRLGNGRYLMEPMVLARLLQEARIGSRDRVLDIGCATGYSAALLADLAGDVVALESDAQLAAHAAGCLAQVGGGRVRVVQGPLDQGHREGAPYDVIVISGGSVAEIPPAIIGQLAPSGRLVAVLRRPGEAGHAVLMRRVGETVSGRPIFDAATPYLAGFEPKPAFQF